MIDFLMISTRPGRKGIVEIYPKFIIKKSSDLMIRGGDFYAVWIEERGLWSTDEQDLIQLVDRELDKYADENRDRFECGYKVLHMWDSETRMIDNWHRYCQRDMRDSYHMLDEKLIFSNTATNKKDYASKKLSYPLEPGSIDSYDRLIGTLYSEEERHKIEWAIGAIVTGDSKKLQKFMVLYGAAGTGKSTIINIIQKLFDGYCAVFDAKALGSSSNAFALEAFKTNPLVAIQHDGDLSRIEDNTRINSLVSHEIMTVNEKFKPGYSNKFKAFLIMGTNKPVKITDAKSGIIRRLIDVSPTGNKLSPKEYRKAVKHIDFELGGIACHCRDVYLANPNFYDDYIPESMLSATNDFYNFVMDNYYVFKKENETTLKSAWEMYKVYCDPDHARIAYPLARKAFQEELKNYFENYEERHKMEDGTRVRCYYSGFNADKYSMPEDPPDEIVEEPAKSWLTFEEQDSIFDKECSSCFAQYAAESGAPKRAWDNVKSTLASIDTKKLHYVRLPDLHHIVIDFDIPGPDGKKDFNRNFEEASKWPPTYAELSRSGGGIHLHYIYTGDPTKLSAVYDDHIEVKVYSGKGALRRKLSKCNNIPIATISSGLPLRGDMKLVNFEAVKNERALRTLISRNLNKEYHNSTTQSINFIHKILEDAYNSDLSYDVSDMHNAVLAFAIKATNQSEYCVKVVSTMHFKSEEPSDYISNDEAPIVFFDVEVFPNLFLVNWKIQGEGNPVVREINPTRTAIERLLKFRLVGFNNRRYDNHMLYARLIGYSNEQLYILSQKIVNTDKKKRNNRDVFFAEAYNLSYTDIYDFSSKKQSLKKFEIELGIHHQELGLPWDQPVPEELWEKVAEYCDNDVIATEAVWNARQADFVAREILAEVAGSTVNDTTNGLTGKIIFGKDKHPQSQFNYRDMGDTNQKLYKSFIGKDNVLYDASQFDEYTVFTEDGKPVFPGYKYLGGKSSYRGEEFGEGGYVYTEPGIYVNVALLDIASMHPSTIMAEDLFGETYTKRFGDILQTRIYIKHKEFDKAKQMMGGCFAKYLDDPKMAKTLSKALKIPINSVYGLTSAHFDNLFRDRRNVDNIVAKRGELFMINLKHEVQKRGFTVAHIKTDSIKIPNATPEIIKFVMDYGKMYGYTFEHETTYERMCLVNKSVYISKHATEDFCKEAYGYIPGDIADGAGGQWCATGDQFAVPYVYKTLFTHEDIEFDDMCETMSVSDAALYLDMNEKLPGVEDLEKLLDLRRKNPEKKTRKELELIDNYHDISDDQLKEMIAVGHDYHFVGKVGSFTPIKPGFGGGVLYRGAEEEDGMRYSSANGAKNFRWMESEMVRTLNMEDAVDRSYYDKLVDAAIATIRKYESEFRTFEWFVSGEEIPDFPVDEPLPY